MPDQDENLFGLPDGGREWDVRAMQIAMVRLSGDLRLSEQRQLASTQLINQQLSQQSKDMDALKSDLRDTKANVMALDTSLDKTVEDAAKLFVPKAELDQRLRPLNWAFYTLGGAAVIGLVGTVVSMALKLHP